MASKSRSGKFAVVLAAVVLTVTGFAAMAHGTGYIVGELPNSFAKRQLGIGPDASDEEVAAMAAAMR